MSILVWKNVLIWCPLTLPARLPGGIRNGRCGQCDAPHKSRKGTLQRVGQSHGSAAFGGDGREVGVGWCTRKVRLTFHGLF